MKILLIHPEEARHKYNFKGIIENECLDLEYLSTVLQSEKHEVFFWDGKIQKRQIKSTRSILMSYI